MEITTILRFIFKTEFLDYLNDNLILKHLYFLYLMTAGVYRESYTRDWFVYMMKIWFIPSIVFFWISFLVSFVLVKPLNFESTVCLICNVSLTASVTLLTYLMVKYERKRLRIVLKSVHDEYLTSLGTTASTQSTLGGDYEEIEYAKYVEYWYFFVILVIFFSILGRAGLCLMRIEDSSEIDNLYDFMFPLPYVRPPTITQYLVIYFAAAAIVIPAILITISVIAFAILALTYVKNQVICLKRDIKQHSDLAVKVIEGLQDRELKLNSSARDKLHDISNEREKYYREFEVRTNGWIRRHQNIIFYMKNLKNFIQTMVTIYLSFDLLPTFLYVTTSIMMDDEKSIYIHYLYAAIFVPYIFLNCFAGHLYEHMMDDLVEEIQSIPWYYLPIKQRKTILNFLCFAQKSNQIRVFNIFPLSLNSFLTILSKLYSYAQALIVMKNKLQ